MKELRIIFIVFSLLTASVLSAGRESPKSMEIVGLLAENLENSENLALDAKRFSEIVENWMKNL